MDKQRQTVKSLLNEANTALLKGQYPLATTIADAILVQKPDYPQGYSIKFKALVMSKKYEQAREIGLHAAALNPTSEYILNNQACLDLDAGEPNSAIKLLSSLLEQHGDQPSWLYNLGLAYRASGQTDTAIQVFERVLNCKPDHDKAAFQLVESLQENGRLEEAVIKQNYLRLLRSNHASAHSQFINLAINTGELSRTQLKQESKIWKKRFIPEEQGYEIETLRNANQITIGFLLGDIPAAWLNQIVAPLVNALAEDGDKVTVYNHNPSSEFFLPQVTQVPCATLTGLDFVSQVRADQIEVMVDVCGFNLGERQSSLGIQVAGKQFGWLAHPGYYASQRVRVIEKELDGLPIFIKLPELKPDSNNKLLPNNTLAAIGCKQGLSNIVVRTWAEILKRQSNIKLHLDATEPSIIQNISLRFASQGINDERLSFAGSYQFNHETVVVDNFVRNDIAEVANAVSHGACVIALKGELFPGKLSARLLKQLDRLEWVSTDRINYVAKVIQQLNEQLKNPVTDAEIKASGLQDLDSFVQQFRKILLS